MDRGAGVSHVPRMCSEECASSFIQEEFPRLLRHLPGGAHQPPTGAEVTAANALAIAVVAGTLIGGGLWLWMAWKNRHGHAWARVLSTVFFGISCAIVAPVAAGNTLGLTITGLVSWAIGLTAVVLLWRSASSQYFRTVKSDRSHSA